jgi:hypothetical protein
MRMHMHCFLPLLAASSLGCATVHPTLDVPPAGAGVELRAEAYERLRPSPVQLASTLRSRGASPVLVLNDGTTIDDARDLLPAVADDSATAQHAARAASLDGAFDWLLGAGLGVSGVADVAMVGEALAAAAGPAQQGRAMVPVLLGTAGVSLLGGLVAGAGGIAKANASMEETAAFNAYDHDLRTRLALVPRTSTLIEQWEP